MKDFSDALLEGAHENPMYDKRVETGLFLPEDDYYDSEIGNINSFEALLSYIDRRQWAEESTEDDDDYDQDTTILFKMECDSFQNYMIKPLFAALSYYVNNIRNIKTVDEYNNFSTAWYWISKQDAKEGVEAGYTSHEDWSNLFGDLVVSVYSADESENDYNDDLMHPWHDEPRMLCNDYDAMDILTKALMLKANELIANNKVN